MNTKAKFISKIVIGGFLTSMPLSQADLFVFPELSTLTPLQQTSLKVLCIKSGVDGVKTLFNEFQKDTLKKAVNLWMKSSFSLSQVFMTYLFNESRKENDWEAVLAYNDAVEQKLPNPEKIYKEALKSENDGLFNGIIRETLKSFKQCILLDSIEDSAQLEEAFNVLWNCLTDANGTFDVDPETVEKVKSQFPDFDIAGTFKSVSEASGKNLCEKIANFLETAIKNAIQQGTQDGNCCCECLGKTCNCIKASLPYVAEVGKITIAIIAALK